MIDRDKLTTAALSCGVSKDSQLYRDLLEVIGEYEKTPMTDTPTEEGMKSVLQSILNVLANSMDNDFALWSSPAFTRPRIAAWATVKGLEAAIKTLSTQPSRPQGEEGGQDRKFQFDAALGQFVNRVSGEPIPLDEPIILFRARDKHALAVLCFYLGQAEDQHHKQAIQERIEEFSVYRGAHPERLKEPGVTKHIRLNSDDATLSKQGKPSS